jgi:hypothetical protein
MVEAPGAGRPVIAAGRAAPGRSSRMASPALFPPGTSKHALRENGLEVLRRGSPEAERRAFLARVLSTAPGLRDLDRAHGRRGNVADAHPDGSRLRDVIGPAHGGCDAFPLPSATVRDPVHDDLRLCGLRGSGGGEAAAPSLGAPGIRSGLGARAGSRRAERLAARTTRSCRSSSRRAGAVWTPRGMAQHRARPSAPTRPRPGRPADDPLPAGRRHARFYGEELAWHRQVPGARAWDRGGRS